MILVAPTEPVALRKVGKVSMFPETVGCDVVVFAGGRKIGVQRKEVADLIASVGDGRLAMQLAQMKGSVLDERIVLIEGPMEYHGAGVDAALVQKWRGGRGGRNGGGRVWTRGEMMGLELSIAARGTRVVRTRDLDETIAWVRVAQKWWGKSGHKAVSHRPAAPTVWGKAQSWEWGAWMLQGFPGIGPELASRIVRKFGRVPLTWTVSAKDLSEVDGVSKVRAAKWIAALASEEEQGDGVATERGA